ncbi:MAG: ATP-dependent helicase [Planctomycetota bacterium]|jgi:DNA helicase-2/ATP-dependent DNA helicase PcrA
MPVDVFTGMNDHQREAIAHLEGPLLVIAGAGSGKTRVITHRIANIIQQGTRPDRILAITFTNKAAGEMQERVESLLGLRTPWIATFHSMGLRILKMESQALGLRDGESLTILDPDGQRAMIKRIIREFKLDPKEFKDKAIAHAISTWKNRLVTPEQASPGSDTEVVFQHCYQEYIKQCQADRVLDFDDLLMRTVQLFEAEPDILEKYRSRFPYILIDEYQDTNAAQYALIKQLGAHGNVCATGDPDQAIYGWRGADIHNILQFEKDFPGTRTVLLEQNYRSTATILRAAQSVVENNQQRKDKTIRTDNQLGDRIRLVTVDDQDDEAMAVAAAAERLHEKDGVAYGDMAVFYRTNHQSRTLEEWLIRRGLPYRIVGGTRFYDRQEVRDLLAYMRLLVNPRDLTSLLRIINKPKRGIGDKAIELLRDLAFDEGVSVYEVLTDEHLLSRIAVGRAAKPLRAFARLIDRLQQADLDDAGACVNLCLDISSLEDFYLESDEERGQERIANLREVLTAAEQFTATARSGGADGSIEAFLDHVSLLTSEDERDSSDDQLVLMTLHASKGLEFPVVFITGCEQGVLPLIHGNAPCDYEEERRLMYVGITRAKQRLYLCNCVVRSARGKTTRNAPSMFLGEIPDECIEHYDKTQRPAYSLASLPEGPGYPEQSLARSVTTGAEVDGTMGSLDGLRASGLLSTGSALKGALRSGGIAQGSPEARKEAAERYTAREPVGLPGDPFAAGDRVVHQAFGPGEVLELTGPAEDRKIAIAFERHGVKTLLVSFAARRLSRS